MAFFSSMALKATQGEMPYKYLSVIETQDYLGYSADEVVDPNAKFAVENAHNGLVHIRSCRTNKYWVRSSTEGYWIVAKASEPLDDKEAWNSTLFRMDLISDDNKATFYHVQSGTVLRIRDDSSDGKILLCIDPSITTEAISTAVDLDSICLLPKYIALKADNGKFFDYETHAFTSDDYGKDSVVNEITTTSDGYIKIWKKGHSETQWWSVKTSDAIFMFLGEGDAPSMLFKVVRVKDKVVALCNLETGKFCRRGGLWYEEDDPNNVLSGSATSIIKEAQFQVVEPVLSRRVQVLDFDLDNSRIYNVTPISSDTHVYDNPTNEVQEAAMNLTISITKTATWNNSISVKAGAEATFETGIPFIFEFEVKVSAEASYTHDFGGSVEETQVVGDTYTVKIPPFKRVTGRGVATKGTCDVPFNYTQVDHLTDGNTVRKILSDGVFTGVNAYNFYHDVHYEDVPEEIKLKFSQLTTSSH